mmetsp:Transcript_73792/g.130355  ORF Transcript_73792/g.130355 Transcript_73792/m.130355 type:complete len:209 (-) Transcript_73792:2-628(-)
MELFLLKEPLLFVRMTLACKEVSVVEAVVVVEGMDGPNLASTSPSGSTASRDKQMSASSEDSVISSSSPSGIGEKVLLVVSSRFTFSSLALDQTSVKVTSSSTGVNCSSTQVSEEAQLGESHSASPRTRTLSRAASSPEFEMRPCCLKSTLLPWLSAGTQQNKVLRSEEPALRPLAADTACTTPLSNIRDLQHLVAERPVGCVRTRGL